MNIGEKHYCSKCFSPLPEEMICPLCGHDPDEKISPTFLEEGTLLMHGRYQIGVPIQYDMQFCYYGAWDRLAGRPVVIKEFFPREMIYRDTTISDEINVRQEMWKQYQAASKAFLEDNTLENANIENRIVQHETSYLVMGSLPHKCAQMAALD